MRGSLRVRGIWIPVLAIIVGGIFGGQAARSQTPADQIPDTVFVAKPHEPISYYTSYDRNVSRAAWMQTLSYAHAGRVAFNIDGSTTTVNALRDLKSDGFDGDVNGSVNVMAARNWTWSLDGRFGLNKTNDERSTTDRQQNKLQIRTQYRFSPVPKVSAMGLVFAEFQREQSIGDKSIPVSRFDVDSLFATHASHDSSYTSGRREGASGTLTWKPMAWLEVGSTGGTTSITSTTNTIKRDFWVSQTVGVEDVDSSVVTNSTVPNGDDRVEAHVNMTGRPGTTASIVLRANRADQQYYALTQRDQEHYKFGTRGATFHAETLPFLGAQASLDLGIDRSFRDYKVQTRYNRLGHGANAAGQFNVFRAVSRASVGFLLTRTQSERQQTQNGTVLSRSVNASGARKVSRRLWLDGGGTVSLQSSQYVEDSLDTDKLLGNLNAGGGYLVSQQCSTTVHFSINRSHDVAIGYQASGNNNVRTTYQMDATLRLQVSRTFTVLQNYQINANYVIYDFNELSNTLNRIRRIDTTLLDSLFTFATIRLTHNFQFQDLGRFTRSHPDEPRLYSVFRESYAQNVTVGVNIRLAPGVIASATQSLQNSQDYFADPSFTDTNQNRWNLNLGVTIDRELPGAMRLNGIIQRNSEYAERSPVAPVDYWVAGITLTKDF